MDDNQANRAAHYQVAVTSADVLCFIANHAMTNIGPYCVIPRRFEIGDATTAYVPVAAV